MLEKTYPSSETPGMHRNRKTTELHSTPSSPGSAAGAPVNAQTQTRCLLPGKRIGPNSAGENEHASLPGASHCLLLGGSWARFPSRLHVLLRGRETYRCANLSPISVPFKAATARTEQNGLVRSHCQGDEVGVSPCLLLITGPGKPGPSPRLW